MLANVAGNIYIIYQNNRRNACVLYFERETQKAVYMKNKQMHANAISQLEYMTAFTYFIIAIYSI